MSIQFKSSIDLAGHRAIRHSDAAQNLVVKVITKTVAHPEYNNGSSSGYTIDGIEGAYLELTPGNTYYFDQTHSSNAGHPLRFYEDASKSTSYSTGVTTNGTPGNAGAYTQIIPTVSTPSVLFYQCSIHSLMGSYAKFGTATTDFVSAANGGTFAGDVTIDGNLDLAATHKITIGPNASWGKSLIIGNNANNSTTNAASIGTTDGNLHLDAAVGSSGTFLNFYDGTDGVAFGNGAAGIVAWMGPDGDLWKGTADNNGSKYWHAGNDGSGSGLDADLLDGINSTSFLRSDVADEATQLTVNTLIIGSSSKIKFQNNDFIRYDDSVGVGRFHFDADGGTNNASVQAATFVGALSGNATSATAAVYSTYTDILTAVDDRDMKPNTSGVGSTVKGVKPFFTSLGGMTGTADSDYQDVLVLDTYSDTSGGQANALSFDKSSKLIKHWQAGQTATSWGTPKTIAYTDSDITGNAATASNAMLLDGLDSTAFSLTGDTPLFTFDSTANLASPSASTGSWTTANTTDWGTPRIGSSVARYNDGTGTLSFAVPTDMKTAYISQLTWHSGGYMDVYGVQSDGGEVFLRRINTKQNVENTNEGNPNQHDGSTIAFAGHIGDFPTILLHNKVGRFHITGLGFSKSELAASDGTGIVNYSQLTGTVPTWNQDTTGNAYTVSNGVYTNTAQTISGAKSFSNTYTEFGNGYGSVSNDGSWHGRVNIAGASHARLDVKDLSDGIITSIYSHTGNGAGKMGTMSDHPLKLLVNGADKVTIDSNSNVTATTFTGALSGNATTATSATTATTAARVTINSDFTGTYPMLVEVESSGTIYNNPSVTYNGTSDTLTSPNFAGNNATFANNVTVGGNLIVNGTTTTLNTQTVEVKDNILQLNTTQGTPDTATAATSGISVYRGDGVTQASLIFDEADDTWDLTNSLAVAGNVGIGTNSPGAKLTIQGADSINAFKITDSGNGDGFKVTSHTTQGTYVQAYDASHTQTIMLDARSDSTARHTYFNGGGNVGIGTASPDSPLHLSQGSSNTFFKMEAYANSQGADAGINVARELVTGSKSGMSFWTNTGSSLTQKMSILGNGNVGIGTTAPSTKLHVVDNGQIVKIESSIASQYAQTSHANDAGAQLITGSIGSTYSDSSWAGMRYVYATAGDLALKSTSSTGNVRIFAGGATLAHERMRINANGNVGIGTASPSYKLDVSGSANNTDVAIRINNTFDDNNSASEPNASLILNAASNNGYLRVHGAPANASAKHQIDLGSTDGVSFLTFSPSGSEKMRVASSGNVGIGTAAPGCKLHIGGTNTVVYNPATVGGQNSGSTIKIANSSTAANTYAAINFSTNSNRVVNRIVSSHAATTNRGFLAFVTEHLGQSGERMRIASDGSVGIGTTSPLVKLDINSTDAIKVPVGTTAQRPTGANGMLRYSTTGNQFEGFADGAWGAIGGGGGGNTTVVVDTFSGDNSDVTFNITNTIANEDNVQIYIDGVYQSKSNYSTSGATITFSTAPPSGTNNIEVTHFVQINGAPSIEVDTFNGNASTTAFTLTTAPATKNNLQIYIDGVYQAKANYSVSGTALTFTTAPATGTNNIEVTHLKIS